MATRYAKLSIKAVVSSASDYTNPFPETQFSNYTSTPECVIPFAASADTTNAFTLDLDQFSSIDYIIVWNKDATNFVSVDYRTLNGGAITGVGNVGVRVAAGKFAILTDVATATDLSIRADTADVDVEGIVVGTTAN